MPRPTIETRRRIIDSEIAQQKAENDTRVFNSDDPPKADRNGKHAQPRKRECSRCGAGAKGKRPLLDWGYVSTYIVCVNCLLADMERAEQRREPRGEDQQAARIEPQPTASTPLPT